ncbi:polyphosphate glucokinase [Candidatus Planktophila lacus]|uniref:ROK family protein n=1 Tax=Candidatus Planktophila lacus TaxID=1884913 RepID=UPI000BAC8C63|nr:ROK family protein [Candidatus Planktophila lacus]ASY29618.1 polyphosphate glucokinase [Candidatus Planktophila lacus]
MANDERLTLSVDCGGLFLKSCVLDESGTMHSKPSRIETPYPLSPDRFIETIKGIADSLPSAYRATVGMPGMIRHGVVISTPHYMTKSGPRTKIDPELQELWSGFDMQNALTKKLEMPTRVLNDAEVHGAGIISGSGYEVVITLGTGLGFAIFYGGSLSPHIEFSHAPVRRATTYDTWIGEHERRRLGNAFWSRRIRAMVDELRPVFMWDRLYIGGGNARCIRQADLDRMGDEVVIVPNAAGVAGGVRAWTLEQYK